ncbi:MAG TPA: gephyrin-like molybdotransferase Glp [Terriglobia bacterium]|nr:gephyrin-like molybdotransferase Glp [Terriglobia bacterium]
MLTFEQALATVREKIMTAQAEPAVEILPPVSARGRVLAEDLVADRDYPPFHRSTRDGFAVRAAEVAAIPVTLDVVGLARAGEPFGGSLVGRAACAVEIMTGAPLPDGTDAVVMIEHTREAASGSASSSYHPARRVEILKSVRSFDNVVRQGSETAAGGRVLPRGRRLGPGEIGLAASIGRAEVSVFAQPQVAILPTGDEVVAVDEKPAWFQIRNSNAMTLAAQAEAAGGVPRLCGIAPDSREALGRLIEDSLACDLLVLSGGISVGKYDFVAEVLTGLGAEFFIQGVAIRPGKPLAFGCVCDRFFFALPGNPVSTFVTFELFVRPAIACLSGAAFEQPVYLKARLGTPVRPATGLTTFMPARVTRNRAFSSSGETTADTGGPQGAQQSDPVVDLVGWQGSGDLVGLAEANCFMVVHPHQTDLAPGDWVDVLPKNW